MIQKERTDNQLYTQWEKEAKQKGSERRAERKKKKREKRQKREP